MTVAITFCEIRSGSMMPVCSCYKTNINSTFSRHHRTSLPASPTWGSFLFAVINICFIWAKKTYQHAIPVYHSVQRITELLFLRRPNGLSVSSPPKGQTDCCVSLQLASLLVWTRPDQQLCLQPRLLRTRMMTIGPKSSIHTNFQHGSKIRKLR